MSTKLFTSESVTEGHPDKMADQISDAILDAMLAEDPFARVAAETLVTTGLVLVSGEITTSCYVDIPRLVRSVVCDIGYTRAKFGFDCETCAVLTAIDEQSTDIAMGVNQALEVKLGDMSDDELELIGAGDQGMMFGYACREMDNMMPMSSELAHIFLQELAAIRREGKKMTYLRPDSKSQVTIEYDENGKPLRIDTIVVSTQHDEFIQPKEKGHKAEKAAEKAMQEKIREDVEKILIPRVRKTLPARVSKLFQGDYKLFVNPTGKFVIGGPHGDTGLTGRKIIVDTYGGHGAHGGGAFSGKDPSKVDRSAAYAARHIAKNLVAAGVADTVMIQVAYAIGVAQPVGFYVNTYGTAHVKDKKGNFLTDGVIAEKVSQIFDLRPYAIVERFGLKNPIFLPTASYGHFGRDPYTKEVAVYYPVKGAKPLKTNGNGKEVYLKKADFFAWEKLDYVDKIKKTFGL